jgi:DNA-directed RNA polymerase subunit RPC12/RpoP
MGTIEEIIKTIDCKLIESGKAYLTFGQANQLLAEKNIISITEKSNKTLRKLLEENKIPHAYQLITPPQEWKIPRSGTNPTTKNIIVEKNYKKTTYQSKNQSESLNHIKCPHCGIKLLIHEEIINEKYIQCLTCGKTFRNPLKINQNEFSGTTKTQRNWLIAIGVFVILIIIGNISKNNNNTESNTNVQNSYLDASVSQVERYLKANLSDADSYESMEWSAVNEMSGNGEYKYWVRHKYRAKNSYGGYVIENKIFYLDSNGIVIGEKDIN